MKQNILTYIVVLTFFSMGFIACTDGFDSLNIDKNQATASSYNFNYSLTAAQLEYAGNSDFSYETWRVNIIYGSLMMQHLSNLSWYAGDKYMENLGWQSSYFDVAYKYQLRYVMDVINHTKSVAGSEALYNAARIMRVIIMHRITDIYGDVPYFDAGNAVLGDAKHFSPKYDSQEDIYTDMLKELDEAQAGIIANTASAISSDLIYGGDKTKWKKMANSMMLRLAMRLTKIKPDVAKTWVAKAIANGVFSSNDDNALIQHQSGARQTVNRINNILGGEWDATGTTTKGKQDLFLSKTLVEFLKNNDDPRLRILAQLRHDGDTSFAKQLGLPNGFEDGGNEKPIQNYALYPGKGADARNGSSGDSVFKFSTINKSLLSTSAPTQVITYAEVALLKAEAIQKGYVTGNAKDEYEAGVKAAMQQYAQINSTSTISDAQVTTYLSGNKKWDASKADSLINEQYWVATFFNWYETWANWRRTNIPTLTPVNFKGNATNGTIPRRMTYPSSEASSNKVNYNNAVSKLAGGNKMTERVWWDKP